MISRAIFELSGVTEPEEILDILDQFGHCPISRLVMNLETMDLIEHGLRNAYIEIDEYMAIGQVLMVYKESTSEVRH